MTRSLSPSFYFVGLICAVCLGAAAQVNVLTSHNDNARTGANTNETLLTPINVSTNGFGELFAQPVDGPVYTQPLYVSALAIPGKGTHNVVFVGTQHASVYAFDADSNRGSNSPPLWHTSFINPAAGITSASTLDAVDFPYEDCHTFNSEIGIVGTPVIDLPSQTLYIVARTKEPAPPPNNQTLIQIQRLHALDITTGLERSNSPVVIDAIVPGTGQDSSGGFVRFNPGREIQRSALLLSSGVVYISFASYCDLDPFHGWVIAYDAHSLQQVGAYNVSPNGSRGAIWMSGAGPAASADGSVFCVTGNGIFDSSGSPTNFGDSFIKLTPAPSLVITDYFTPFDQGSMNTADNDLGSGGVLLLPDSAGSAAHPHLMVGCGKLGKLYLIDRDNLGHYNPAADTQLVQSFNIYSAQAGAPHFFGLPVFFNGRLYIQGVGEYLKAFSISNALFNTTPFSQSPDSPGFRGATPSISANGTTNGIVWQMTLTSGIGTSFRAYNAENLSQRLYDSLGSSQIGLPDQISYLKFVVPTIANGKVYLADGDSLTVFGLRSIIRKITRDPVSGTVHLVYYAPLGITTVIQASLDLVNWFDLGPGTPQGNGVVDYFDPPVAGDLTRFYRIKP
jgi:hypothetical protein